MRAEALAKNEELFRNVNERIESLSQAVAPSDQAMEYLCECDRPGCYERVRATREEYESVRAVATHFIVLAGHEDRQIERVAFSNERFLTIEKQGAAALDAVENDPRN
jgi:alpha-D-ribose 1-methylphosphonate 5-triphosphate diphosphatase PhnM